MKILFVMIAMLAVAGSSMAEKKKPTLIGGTPADPKEWPASVYASMGGASCSATVVGERVLFIAAHCVSNGGTARFSVGANQYTGRCKHAPEYRNNSTADYAICLTDRKVEGAVYEMVNNDASRVKKGEMLQLTGYGCVRPGGGGGNDGVFRIGKSAVTKLPSGTNNDIVTKGTAALCFGDSGGAIYSLSADGSRYVVGVNSRGNISNTSYLSSWTTPMAVSFIRSWSSENNQKICGVSVDAVGCRGGGEEPPPPPPPCTKVPVEVKSWMKDVLAE